MSGRIFPAQLGATYRSTEPNTALEPKAADGGRTRDLKLGKHMPYLGRWGRCARPFGLAEPFSPLTRADERGQRRSNLIEKHCTGAARESPLLAGRPTSCATRRSPGPCSARVRPPEAQRPQAQRGPPGAAARAVVARSAIPRSAPRAPEAPPSSRSLPTAWPCSMEAGCWPSRRWPAPPTSSQSAQGAGGCSRHPWRRSRQETRPMHGRKLPSLLGGCRGSRRR